MNQKRTDIAIALLAATCILVNVIGGAVAQSLSLPLWLDSFGTVFAAYLMGPVSGAIVGFAGSLTSSLLRDNSFLYGITGACIGIIVGLASRRGNFETVFGTLSCASLVTLVAVAISTPLNIVLAGGMTQNPWGDGVIEFMRAAGVNPYICYATGQFYLDFLDKVVTLLALFATLRLRGRVRRKPKDTKAEVLCMVALALVTGLLAPGTARADTRGMSAVDFYAATQTVYGSSNGLPCGEANDIAQTSDGVLWIGTYAGLYRYSGTEFKAMSDFESVRNVNCLFVDDEGRLWVGTNDNGLVLVINEVVGNVLDTSSGLPSNSIRAITSCSDGTYYVGTSDALQVIGLDGGLKLLQRVDDVTFAKSLSADDLGHVAAVSASGQLFVLEGGKVLASTELPAEEGSFTCCLYDKTGELLTASSDGGVYTYALEGGELVRKDTHAFEGLQKVSSLNETDDELLFACADNGVGCMDRDGSVKLLNLNGFDNSIDHMLVDYQGNYWFTSSRLGLLRMASSSFSDVYEAAGADHRLTNAIVRWQGLLYVGTDTGLDVIDDSSNEVVHNDLSSQLDGTRIRCMRVDSSNHLWVCTYGQGLLEVDERGTITRYDSSNGFSDRVRVALELSQGGMAASGDNGLAFIDDGKLVNVVPYGPDFCSSQILCLLQDEDGSLYAGTDGDGIVVLKGNAVTHHITTEDGLSSNVILRIVWTADNTGAYVVTSNGLCLIEGATARQLTRFPYSNNFDVWTTSDSRVFVLGSAGIYVVREKELLADTDAELSYELLDAKRGLAASLTANSWNWCEGEDLYLANDAGILRLNLDNYSSTQQSYRMKLSSIMFDDSLHHVERGSTINVSSDVDRIVMLPEIVSYALDDPYVSFQLKGYDRKPSTMRRSELADITYTNLSSGDYQFWIAVLDNDRNVLEESTYSIHKELEFYDHLWFFLYFVGVGGLALAWLGWFVARTQVQRTIEFQRKQLEFQNQQLEFSKQQIELGNQTVMAIARTVDAKDVRTAHHSQRVSEYAVLLAQEMGFSEEECENIRKTALLHDIGKIGIPDAILNKPSRLTDEEYAIMKSHVTRGAEILKGFTMIDHVIEGALYHHERYDGKGYVSGLAGEDIPLYGRIIAVADTFDAMTQNRVYRSRQDMAYVIGELEKGAGTQFDPDIAQIMLRLLDEGKLDHILYGEEES